MTATKPIKVAFLIDERSLTQSLFTLDHLLACIKQILLFYRSVTSQVSWSFRFFSTITRYSSMSMRYFDALTLQSLELIPVEYQKLNIPDIKSGTPIGHIKQALKDAIGDFQWDIDNYIPSENYVFILTPCPLNASQLDDFFDVGEDTMQKCMRKLTKELAATHVDVYTQYKISANIIDTTTKSDFTPIELSFQDYVSQIMSRLFKPFNGRHIKLQDLTDYGNSMISHSANFLPCKPLPIPTTPAPVWSGILTFADNKYIGNIILYPQIRNAFYDPQLLAFTNHIRILEFMHISQVSLLWFPNEEKCSSYTLNPDAGNFKNQRLFTLIGMLYHRRSVVTVELLPMKEYKEEGKKMAIVEALTPTSGHLRLLSQSYTPGSFCKSRDVSKPDPYYPIGAGLLNEERLTESLKANLPKGNSTVTPKFVSCLPDFLKKRLEEKAKQKIPQIHLEESDDEEEERIIRLPSNTFNFAEQFKTLYYETLYLRKDILEDFITIVDKWIEHLQSLGVPVNDIVYELEKHALTREMLDTKHQVQVPKAKQSGGAITFTEQQFQEDWWQQLLQHPKYNPNEFEKLSLTALRLREAQLQVILYCFICKLMIDNPNKVTYDPDEAAQAFFIKMVLIFQHNKVEDFLLELDAEEEYPTKRDPCDLVDLNFAYVLEEKFKDCLPELVVHFKEAAGDDDLMSIPDDGEEDMFALEIASQEKRKTEEQIHRNLQAKRPQLTHTSSSSRSYGKQKSQPSNFKPEKPKRANTNPIDLLMKRTVQIQTRVDTSTRGAMGEAAKAAISKIERTMVDGKPTMKRVGSFIKSALSPKRPKTQPNYDGTVTLRKTRRPDPNLTPRTSLSRYLNADIFNESSEYCVSPSRDNPQVTERIPSAYPRTPQGTSSRYRKTMMETTPSRHEDDAAMDFSYSERLEAFGDEERRGLNLTAKFQNMVEEAEIQVDASTLSKRKSKLDDLFNDDD